MSGGDVIIALDFPSAEAVYAFLDKFENEARKPYVKVGMELFYAEGPQIVREIKARGHKIFLDLKLHDIPNTVKKAMASLSRLDVDMTNLHAAGTIEIRHGVGAFVRESPAVPHDPLGLSLCPPDPAVRFSAWLEACLAVEPPAAELAAQRAEESELAEMEDLAVQMERCLGPAEQIEEHIRQFHTALVAAAHNPILARLFQSLQDSFPLPPDETGEAFFLRQAQGCREILSFLRLRDGLGASLAARRCLLQLQTDPKEKRHGP